MISKNQQKLIRALDKKKQRNQLGLFLVQGEKNVIELLSSSITIKHVFASQEFIAQNQCHLSNVDTIQCSEAQLNKAGTLVSNNAAIAIAAIPNPSLPKQKGISVVLDGISDPGNLGTIIRLADWYGLDNVICSLDSADPYNPKTISATMGSFARINCIQTDIKQYLTNDPRPKYGAFLNGQSVHNTELPEEMVLIMGSESHGIRDNIADVITDKITIPAFGQAESLNVAMATGIILDNYIRCQNTKR